MVTNILDYLEASEQRFPHKTAIADNHTNVTYEELVHYAKAIGSALGKKGSFGKPVAIFIDRDVESVISFMGTAYSDNFYIPIDRKLPQNRICLILETTKPEYMIIRENDEVLLEELALSKLCPECKVLQYQKVIKTKIKDELLKAIREQHIDTNPLYSIFTSGSTGVPKGVVVCHRSVIDLVEQFKEAFDFDEHEVFANQAPFDFDVSVKDLYSTLKNAGTMHIVAQNLFMQPKKMIAYLNENKVTTMIWAVSALSVLATLKAFKKDKPQYLKKVMFSGEVMPMKILHYWQENVPDAMYVNLYGPTEITCNCTYYIVDREFSKEEVLPIGKPFKNTQILLLDEKGNRVKDGEIGEICVRGTSLALGYYNNEEVTAKAFCQNPLNPHYPELIYRTGDLGRYNKEGELVFASRKDAQIKHMGHRIELGEIELIVNSLDFIVKGCCVYDKPAQKIVLFYEAEKECEEEIILELYKHLPKYMCPNRYVYRKEMLINKNGKIDRAGLREIVNTGGYHAK